jgi:hypothetical protein
MSLAMSLQPSAAYEGPPWFDPDTHVRAAQARADDRDMSMQTPPPDARR